MSHTLPQRKEIRLKGYDYSLEGYYFITICTKNRECILSKININDVGVAPQGDPQIELTYEGNIVKKYLENYNKNFNNI